jgi:hypothetical protein
MAETVWTMCDPVRTMSSIRQVVHTKFNRPDISLQGPDAQILIMEIACNKSATVRMLGQAVRTLSGILIITFYSNIGLGQNQRHWKANKKLCKLMVRTANRIVWTAPVRTETSSGRMAPLKIREFFRIAFRTRKQLPVQTAKDTVRTCVPETPFFTGIRASKAYK